MKTRCPYPDCLCVFEIESANKMALFNAQCQVCHRLGRVKALEITDKLKTAESRLYGETDRNSLLAPVGKFQVLLEDVRSLWNVGSIFRTADAVTASKLYLCGITGFPPRDEISKTALGAEQDIPWTYTVQSLTAVNHLKSAGVKIIGLERNDYSIDLANFLREGKAKMPICLVVGNEVAGLSPEALHSCDIVCHLPMKGKKESLNVASAFAVAAYFIDQFV